MIDTNFALSCSLKVRMDRYFWSICNALAEIDDWASADMIRMKLKDHRVDLTSMRIATRISHNKLIELWRIANHTCID